MEHTTPPDKRDSPGDEWREPIIVESDPAVEPAAPVESDEILRDDPPAAEEPGWSAQFVAPFQYSGPLPASNAEAAHAGLNGTGSTVHRSRSARRFPLLRVILVCAVILLAGGFLALTVFAQPGGHPITTTQHSTQGLPAMQTAPAARPTHTVQKTPTPITPTPTQGSPQGNWVPSAQTLQQMGWTGAGLSTGDALEAERTAWTFNDREMSLDYRDAGTPGQHGGTFTAATFLLTPNARTRFFANDVRVINNALFDRVEQRQMIQEVVNAQPRLVLFQVQGQQQFAWVDVSFQLWQSQVDPQTGNRVDGFEIDPATNAPRIHHMIVLLLRVDIAGQGTNAPMGGSGWLVSIYALDPAGGNLPAVIPPA